jgi:hypothetical protein
MASGGTFAARLKKRDCITVLEREVTSQQNDGIGHVAEF